MSMTRFAYVCDKCQKRGEEYGYMPHCTDCGDDCCPSCDVPSERDEESGLTLCRECADYVSDAGGQ